MASPPTWTNSAGMLSTTADFPIFSVLTAASTSSRRMGDAFQRVYVGSSCKGLSSTVLCVHAPL